MNMTLPEVSEMDDETVLVIQGGKLRQAKNAISSLVARVQALEFMPPNSLHHRVKALESWRENRAAAIPNSNSTFTGMGLTVLGLSVASASATEEVLRRHENRINSVLAALRHREIINA